MALARSAATPCVKALRREGSGTELSQATTATSCTASTPAMHPQKVRTIRQYRLRTRSRLCVGELVSIPPDRENHAGRRRIALDLAAQMTNERVDAPLGDERLSPPDQRQQFLAR